MQDSLQTMCKKKLLKNKNQQNLGNMKKKKLSLNLLKVIGNQIWSEVMITWTHRSTHTWMNKHVMGLMAMEAMQKLVTIMGLVLKEVTNMESTAAMTNVITAKRIQKVNTPALLIHPITILSQNGLIGTNPSNKSPKRFSMMNCKIGLCLLQKHWRMWLGKIGLRSRCSKLLKIRTIGKLIQTNLYLQESCGSTLNGHLHKFTDKLWPNTFTWWKSMLIMFQHMKKFMVLRIHKLI